MNRLLLILFKTSRKMDIRSSIVKERKYGLIGRKCRENQRNKYDMA